MTPEEAQELATAILRTIEENKLAARSYVEEELDANA